MKDEHFEYDVQKCARAASSAIFRVVVAAYIIYLGWTVLRGVLNGSSPVPVWVAWLVAIVFTACAAVFLVYTWKTYLRDREAARILPSQPQQDEIPEKTDPEDNAQ